MGTHYNAQIDNKNKIYSIQFETDSYRKYKEVEKICQAMVDKSNEERTKAYWREEYDDTINTLLYICSECGATYVGLPRTMACPVCLSFIVDAPDGGYYG